MRAIQRLIFLLGAVIIIPACQTTATVKLGETATGGPPAILLAPVAQELLAFDNQKLTPPLANHAVRYELPPGKHELVFRYVGMLEDDYGDARVVRSEFMTVSVELKPGQRYELHYPVPTNLATGQKYAKAPTLSVVEVGTGLEFEARALGFRQGLVEVFGEFFAKSDTCREADSSACLGSETGVLARLKQNWQEASAEDRRKFQEFIKIGQ